MTLQAVYRQPEEIPEHFRELYSAGSDGVWRLTGIEGLIPEEERTKLETELAKEHRLREQNDSLFKRAGIQPDHLEDFIAGNEQMRSELKDLRSRVEREALEKALTRTAAEKGIRPEAIRDVLAQGTGFQTGEDGSFSCCGKSVEEWMDEQIKSSPHWLAPSRSANARSIFNDEFPRHVKEQPSVFELISKSWNSTKG